MSEEASDEVLELDEEKKEPKEAELDPIEQLKQG